LVTGTHQFFFVPGNRNEHPWYFQSVWGAANDFRSAAGGDSHNGLSIPTKEKSNVKINLCRASGMLAIMFFATSMTFAREGGRSTFVLTSTNNANGNEVVVFELDTAGGYRGYAFAILGKNIANGR
jgi:hypothetical protein